MKKLFTVISTAVICLSLSGCYKGEEVNLLLFTDNLNNIKQEQISLSDYFIENGSYKLILQGDIPVLVTAEEAENKVIKKVRLTISKADNNGNIKAVADSEAEFFSKEATDILEAFTMYEKQECEKIISRLIPDNGEDFSKSGELTAEINNFCLVYYSNKICSQFFVVNTFYEEIESTSKPDTINP